MSRPNISLRHTKGPRREFLGIIVVGVAIGVFGWWVSRDPQLPNELANPLFIISGLVFIGGIFLYNRAAEGPSLIQEEREIDSFHPSVIIAQLMMAASLLPLGISLYLYRDTIYPYVYVFIPLCIGVYLLVRGLIRYWKNTLTTNYLTTSRIMSEVRFFGKAGRQAPLTKPNTVNPRSPWYCRVFGLETIVFDMPGRNIRFLDAPSNMNIADKFEAIKQAERDRKRNQENENLASSIRDALEQSDDKAQPSESHNEKDQSTHYSDNAKHESNTSEPKSDIKEKDDDRSENKSGEPEPSDPYNEDGSIPLGDKSKDSNPSTEPLENKKDTSKHDADAQTSDSLEDSIEQLEEVTSAFAGDGTNNPYLWALVEKQAKEVESLGTSVILPEIGSTVDPSIHRVIRTRPSNEPKGTILSVVRAGLKGENIKSRDADVITSSGSSPNKETSRD